MTVANTRAVKVELAEAARLADLYGVSLDLRAAASFCLRAITFDDERRDYSDVVEGLVAAAVVRYFRCFAGGPRLGLLRDDLKHLDGKDLAAHDYLKALRDKFVAHSVNPFEETFVTVTARESDGVLFPIESVHPGQSRVILSSNEARALAHLISNVLRLVDERIDAEEKRLLKTIQALPLETIHAGDLHTPRVLKDEDVFKTRPQTRRQ